jgi:tagatose-6-phosphate ketose/aldose isomerase
MTQLHHRSLPQWDALGGGHTAREIAQQPAVWRQLPQCWDAVPAQERQRISALLANPQASVILTGAGTSAYAGELAADTLNAACAAQVRAVATTTLLSNPALFVTAQTPLLVVSFARSGNSPESQAIVDLVRQLAPATLFLNITCNAEGLLARSGAGRDDTVNVVLPAASCDQGFAMTSSFTSMLLTALALLSPEPLAASAARIEQLAGLAERWIVEQAEAWHVHGQAKIKRIVYLGGGPLEALAREAALKVLELSGGRILAISNSPLGFRHGPKSVVDPQTMVAVFRSQDQHVRQYDQDLLDELQRDKIAGSLLSIDGRELGAPAGLPDAWLAAAYVVFAQVLALHQSVRLGLTPDNPFPDGTVNRVVQGVIIHPYASA